MFLNQFCFSKKVQEGIQEILNFWKNFRKQTPIYELSRTILRFETQALFTFIAKDQQYSNFKKFWEGWIRWNKTRPLLVGKDLKKLKIPPGPKYLTIFRALNKVQYNRKIRSKRQASNWVKQYLAV